MKSFASFRLGFSLLACSALLTGCFSTEDFLVEEDAWDDLGEGIGENFGEGIACSVSRSILVPARETGSIRLNGFGQAPTAIPIDSESVLTLSFASEPIDLSVTALGPVEVVEIGETSCGTGDEGDPEAIPYLVTVTLDAKAEIGRAELEVRLGGKLVESFRLDVAKPASISAQLSDGEGRPVSKLAVDDAYYLQGILRAENGAPIYGAVDFTIASGNADLTPYFVGAFLNPYEAGKLTIQGQGGGLSQRFDLEVGPTRK